MVADNLPIAVIGAGFSGTMTALHLLKRGESAGLLLCERGQSFARGLAYSTDRADHLLNVRATNMSAFPDQPGHFTTWLENVLASQAADLKQHIQETAAGTFVSRDLYGRYLSNLLDSTIESGTSQKLTLVREEVVDLEQVPEGYRLVLANGANHTVAGAVLAIGNLVPNQGNRGSYIANPWNVPLAEDLAPDQPVVIIGTGLTMIDLALHLRSTGFRGPVIAISRRGLNSQAHVPTTSWPTPEFTDLERSSTLTLARRVRREIAQAAQHGIVWQSVIDSLRPVTSALWQGMPATEQARFLRHLKPWWDVHRHRAAPPIAQAVSSLMKSGWLQVRGGRIIAVETGDEGQVLVRYRSRGRPETVEIRAQRVIDATGTLGIDAAQDPLLMRMRERGLVRPDRHGLGLDVTDDLRLIAKDGRVSPRLWALGPIVRGVLLECTAVPDIRRQAAELAEHIAATPFMTSQPERSHGESTVMHV
jgi:uncharacterized NAD(P)/FAD-binding protein YdhS